MLIPWSVVSTRRFNINPIISLVKSDKINVD